MSDGKKLPPGIEALAEISKTLVEEMMEDDGSQYAVVMSVSLLKKDGDQRPVKSVHQITEAMNIGRAKLRLEAVSKFSKRLGLDVYREEKPRETPVQ